MNRTEHTVNWLIRGRREVLDYYSRALEIWSDIQRDLGFDDVERLAAQLRGYQMQFETECGGRFEGQEVMLVSGIAQFYNPEQGFEDNQEQARNLTRAIVRSGCSIEVKHGAVELAHLYGLFGEDEIEELYQQW